MSTRRDPRKCTPIIERLLPVMEVGSKCTGVVSARVTNTMWAYLTFKCVVSSEQSS